MVVSNIFYVHPYLGKISILTNIFQKGLKRPTRKCKGWVKYKPTISSKFLFTVLQLYYTVLSRKS